MFTGLIEETGVVRAIQKHRDPGLLEITGSTLMESLKIGDSIAVNGVCLTAITIGDTWFRVEVSGETFSRTNIGQLKQGDILNLERSLTLSDRLGGHLVLGHVDGTGNLVSISREKGNTLYTFSVEAALSKYIVDKGSIAVDGISLTPFNVSGNTFSVSVIPLTVSQTNLQHIKHGDSVNVEVDILAKYIESLLNTPHSGKKRDLDKNFLRKHGYA